MDLRFVLVYSCGKNEGFRDSLVVDEYMEKLAIS